MGVIQGMALHHYRPGEVYDLPPSLAECLVMEKYAIVEMRDQQSRRTEGIEERRRRP